MDISIVIPYNRDRGFLAEALESCYKQDFKGSFEVVPFRGEYLVSYNLNKAIAISKGEYIKLMAEDDILLPDCLTNLFGVIRTGFDLVCAHAYNFNKTKQWPFYSQLPLNVRTLSLDNTIHGLTVMYRRSSLEKVAVNGEIFRTTWSGLPLDCAEEYELHLRMLAAGMRFGLYDGFVGKYRIHSNQKSLGVNFHTGDRIKQRYDTILSIKRHYECR